MATAEELLSGVLNGSADSITVDTDLRKIIIPDSIRNIGVESDEEVLDLKVTFPRYYGRYDLSEFKFWVSYLTANGEPDVHEVKEMIVTEDKIAFVWQVGRHTTSYRGDVVFAFRLCKYFGHIILKEFNTTIATLPVLEGLQTGAAVVQNHADLLEQWRIELFGLGDSKVQAIENAGDVELAAIEEARVKSVANVEAVETNILDTLETQRLQSIDDVEQKGVEVLASIPEDYTAVNNQVEMLSRFTAPVIREEVAGETINIADSSRNPFLGLKMYGKSEQLTSTGHQMFDTSRFKNYSNGGITLTNNGDGSLTLSNTGESTVYFNTGFSMSHEETIAMLKAGTLRLKTDKTTYPYISVQVKGDGVVYAELTNLTSTNSKNPITAEMLNDESLFIHCCFFGMADKTFEGGTVRPVLYMEEDWDGTWEPFSGGKPAPNPEYPQKIVTVENPTIYIYGKNLLDVNSLLNEQLISNNDGTYTLTKNGAAGLRFSGKASCNIPAGTYTFSVGNVTGDETGIRVALTYASGKEQSVVCYPDIPKTLTTVDTTVRISIYIPSDRDDGVYSTFDNLMMESGSVVTDYEDYAPSQVLETTAVLPGVPVQSNGNYTDKNGQRWVCDEIDESHCVYIQRVIQKTFSGSADELWISYAVKDGTTHTAYQETKLCSDVKPFDGDSSHKSYLVCDSFAVVPLTDIYDTGTQGISISNASGRIRLAVDECQGFTPEEFTAWLNEHPFEILYILAKPIEIPLTAEEIEAFKALHTNYPNTTILNDSGAYMEAAYAVDTKMYIDNKFKSIS